MYPQSHFLFPLLIGLVLEKLGYVGLDFVLVAVLIGVFVDLDHPLKHFLLTGELNPKKTWNAGIVKHEDDRTFIHHKQGILMMSILFIVFYAYFPYWTTAVALGYYSHMLLDHFSTSKGFIDTMKLKDYWGYWKPVSLKIYGFDTEIALHEIALDLLLIIGLFIITF